MLNSLIIATVCLAQSTNPVCVSGLPEVDTQIISSEGCNVDSWAGNPNGVFEFKGCYGSYTVVWRTRDGNELIRRQVDAANPALSASMMTTQAAF